MTENNNFENHSTESNSSENSNIDNHQTDLGLQMLVSFVHDPEFLSKSIETVLQYKHELLNIHGSFPCKVKGENQIEPFIITVEGSETGLEHPIFVLPYLQQGMEHEFEEMRTKDADLELEEHNLFAISNSLLKGLESNVAEKCYIQIKYNSDQNQQNDYDNGLLMVSLAQLSAYKKVILNLSNITSIDPHLSSRWLQVPLRKLRSQLYDYALQHNDISKLYIAIFSTTLYIYYELNTQHTDLKHQQAIEKFVQPFILDPFMLSVQNINQGIQFISEDQLDMFYRSALLYKQSQWHFWLLRWFRVKKSTPMVNIDLQ